jgi:uncharacterized protein (DUF2249 family)
MMETMTEQTLDVRPIEPRHKHPTIFKLWQDLPQGGSFVLLNDHDPVPLYYQFACEHVGGFRWDYLERGPQTWRVRISKGEFPDPGFKPERKSAVAAAQVELAQPITVDTRPIFARGGTPCQAIDDAIAQIITGQTLILLVPFEPKPLYSKLENAGFTRQTVQQPDGTFRIEFKRESMGRGPVEACGPH